MASGLHDTTSAGMPSIATTPGLGADARPLHAAATGQVRNIADAGKAQITTTIAGVVAVAREIADKLDANGAAPVARYAHQAADVVADWSSRIEDKSVDELLDDTRHLVRINPAVAVGISVAAGFVLARFLRATPPGRGF